MNLIFNIASLAAAFLALAVSGAIASRQSTMMRHANEIPFLMATLQEFRSLEFRNYQHFVDTELARNHPPGSGVTGLPYDARTAATALVTFFNIVGSLLIHNIADESILLPFFAYRANSAWKTLEPYIANERQNRPDDMYACYFEHLVCHLRNRQAFLQTHRDSLDRMPANPPVR